MSDEAGDRAEAKPSGPSSFPLRQQCPVVIPAGEDGTGWRHQAWHPETVRVVY